jgi:Cu(I)/Ag(I) efflux system membrane fusion protein
MKRDSKLLLGTLAIGVAVLGYALLWPRSPGPVHAAHATETRAVTATEKPPLYWYDPMVPDQHFDKPGKSPFMDMQLVPKYGDDEPAGKMASGGIGIDARVVQNLGVRLAQVEKGRFAEAIDAVGAVAVDEHRIEAVQVRQGGWVEQLGVRAVGDAVHRGQRLAGIYSPDLLATQQELLIALRASDPLLIEAARRRLLLFGLSTAQIARVEKSGLAERRTEYFAPFDGFVMELGVRQGAAVQPGMTLFQLADLSTVWVIAEVPEAQAGRLQPGNTVQASVPALPGEVFDGRVDYLYPELSAATRTLKVRIIIGNRARKLRPGMFASLRFKGVPRENILSVPSEAVIRTGQRSLVILAEDEGHFRPVPVRVGAEQDGRSEILEGLTEQQQVVASGQFLIDSEASLRGAFKALTAADEPAMPEQMPAPSQGVH